MFAVTIRDEHGELLIGVVTREEDAARLVQERELRLFQEELARSRAHDQAGADAAFRIRLLKALRACAVTRLG